MLVDEGTIIGNEGTLCNDEMKCGGPNQSERKSSTDSEIKNRRTPGFNDCVVRRSLRQRKPSRKRKWAQE